MTNFWILNFYQDKQNQICKYIFDKEEIDEDFEILCKIRSFYETRFKNYLSKSLTEIENVLNNITTASLNNDQAGWIEHVTKSSNN